MDPVPNPAPKEQKNLEIPKKPRLKFGVCRKPIEYKNLHKFAIFGKDCSFRVAPHIDIVLHSLTRHSLSGYICCRSPRTHQHRQLRIPAIL